MFYVKICRRVNMGGEGGGMTVSSSCKTQLKDFLFSKINSEDA